VSATKAVVYWPWRIFSHGHKISFSQAGKGRRAILLTSLVLYLAEANLNAEFT
jgi:hypothetical protein